MPRTSPRSWWWLTPATRSASCISTICCAPASRSPDGAQRNPGLLIPAFRFAPCGLPLGLYEQRCPLRARNLHPAAGGAIGTGDAPDGVADAHGPGAVDDRLLEREHATDEALGPFVQERLIARALVLSGGPNDPPPHHERGHGQEREA